MTKSKIIPFPNKKYNIIYADCPWSFRDKCVAGKRGSEFKYPCMKTEEISSLPIRDISLPDSCLFLWVPTSLLLDGLKVMESWGYQYKTIAFTWVKKGQKSGKLFWGMGSYTRNNCEICLLGIRGRLKRISKSVHQIVESPKREHSRKPDEVRDRITQLYGDIPKIELFARERVENWDAWGLAVRKDGKFNNK